MTPAQIARVAEAVARKADAMSSNAGWYPILIHLDAIVLISATIASECKAIANENAHEP